MKAEYGLGEMISNACSLIYTKIFWKKARLIRRPFYCRGKKNICYGEKLTIGYGCRFESYLVDGANKHGTIIIGQNCKFGDRVHISAGEEIVIGSDCLFASNILLNDSQHGVYGKRNMQSSPIEKPDDRVIDTMSIELGNRIWIGENVVILQGTKLGDGCIVGANSVVKGIFPENCILAGTPAKIIKRWNQEEKQWKR